MKMTEADVIWARIAAGSARALAYDFATRLGTLHLAEGQLPPTMLDCVRLFVEIDPRVRVIETVAGAKPDASYQRLDDGRWLRR